jgi:hypothetical protein
MFGWTVYPRRQSLRPHLLRRLSQAVDVIRDTNVSRDRVSGVVKPARRLTITNIAMAGLVAAASIGGAVCPCRSRGHPCINLSRLASMPACTLTCACLVAPKSSRSRRAWGLCTLQQRAARLATAVIGKMPGLRWFLEVLTKQFAAVIPQTPNSGLPWSGAL